MSTAVTLTNSTASASLSASAGATSSAVETTSQAVAKVFASIGPSTLSLCGSLALLGVSGAAQMPSSSLSLASTSSTSSGGKPLSFAHMTVEEAEILRVALKYDTTARCAETLQFFDNLNSLVGKKCPIYIDGNEPDPIGFNDIWYAVTCNNEKYPSPCFHKYMRQLSGEEGRDIKPCRFFISWLACPAADYDACLKEAEERRRAGPRPRLSADDSPLESKSTDKV